MLRRTTSRQYACELYRSIDDVNADEWQEVCRGTGSMSLDRRFLKAVELSFAAEAKFWYAVYRDDAGRTVAAPCFSRYLGDAVQSAPPPSSRGWPPECGGFGRGS